MFNLLLSILNIFGYISTVLFIWLLIKGISLWIKGILPVLLRLGNGLAKGKIAIFADNTHSESLEQLLCTSGLFRRNNIIKINDVNSLYRSETCSLYLVFWHDWQNEIDNILNQKKQGIPLIIYAPQELGFIPRDKMTQLNNQPNTIVTNFRGRLLNDIIISLITGSYKR